MRAGRAFGPARSFHFPAGSAGSAASPACLPLRPQEA
jgi:hypothetical protein